MKIILVAIGKTGEAYLREGIEKFTKRIPHYVPFEFKMLPDVKTKLQDARLQKLKEGEAFLDLFRPGDVVVLLDDKAN